jgi:hypothetical protein
MRPQLNSGTLGGRMTRSGDLKGLHVETDCCTSCGIPWTYAPEVFGEGEQSCLVVKQPQTPTEMRRVLRVFQYQDLNCVRYAGGEPRILAILERAGCADACGPYTRNEAWKPISSAKSRAASRPILVVFGVTSVLSVIGGFAAAVTLSLPGVLGCAVGLAGLFFTHAAWHRRIAGFWGLIVLAGVNTLIAVVATILGRNVGVLGPLLWVLPRGLAAR